MKRLGHAVRAWLEHARTRRPRRDSYRIWWRRRVGALVLLTLVLGMGLAWWHYTEDTRVKVQAVLALEHVTGGRVTLDSASLSLFRQVRIKGLKVYLPNAAPSEDTLVFTAEDVILEHRPSSVLMRRLRLRSIVAYGACLRIRYDRDRGVTNLQQLDFSGRRSTPESRPRIVLREARLEYGEIEQGVRSQVAHQQISGVIEPDPQNRNRYNFTLQSADEGVLGGARLEGHYDLLTGQMETKGQFLLHLIDLATLPERVATWQELYAMSQPQGELTTHSRYDPQTGATVLLEVKDGRLKLPLPNLEVPLENVQARFRCTREQILIEQLTGQCPSVCRLTCRGVVHGYTPAAGFNVEASTEGLIIPAGQWSGLLTPRQLQAQPTDAEDAAERHVLLDKVFDLLPRQAQDLVRWYAPTGQLDIETQVHRPPATEETRPAPLTGQGVILMRDVAITFHDFPYRLEHVAGKIVYDGVAASIGPLRATAGPAQTVVQGEWAVRDGRDRFDVTVRSKGAPLDERLYRALQPRHQRLWDDLQPQGFLDVDYRARKQFEQEHYDDELDLQLHELALAYRPLPVPITQAQGQVHWQTGQAAFEISDGNVSGGTLSLRGTVSNLAGAHPQADIGVEFADVGLDEAFGGYLQAREREFYEAFALAGRATGSLRFRTDPNALPADDQGPRDEQAGLNLGAGLRYRAEIALADGSLRPEALAYRLTDVEATVVLTEQALEILQLRGMNGRTRAMVSGRLEAPESFALDIDCRPLELGEEFRAALARRGGFWARVKADGLANVRLSLRQAGPQAELDYEATIEPQGCRLGLTRPQVTLPDVTGRLRLTPEQLRIERLESRRGAARLEAQGRLHLGPRDVNTQEALDIRVDALPMDATFRAMLPEGLGRLYAQLDPNGLLGADLQLDRAGTDPNAPWQIQGTLDIREAGMARPLAVDQLEASLRGTGRYTPATSRLDLDGQLEVAQVRVRRRPLRDLRARLTYAGDTARLSATQINGVLCDGQLAAELNMQLGASEPDYAVELLFEDVDLPALLAAPAGARRAESLEGSVAGAFSMRQAGGPEQRSGHFRFDVTDAVLGELPIAAQLLHVLNLSLPREGAFNEAHLVGDLAGPRTRFEQIQLVGSAVSLTGAGVMTGPNQQLELVFLVDDPQYLPKLPLITSFLQAVKPTLVQVRVSGTFDEPKVEPLALPTLDDAVRGLTGEKPRGSF